MKGAMIAGGLAAAVLAVCAYGVYLHWSQEPQRARGPLWEALLAQYAKAPMGDIPESIVEAYMPRTMTLAERKSVLADSGFDCAILPARVRGNHMLSCRRPIDGTHNCERINYFAYETRDGKVIDSLASIYHEDRMSVFGLCPYTPPSPKDEQAGKAAAAAR